MFTPPPSPSPVPVPAGYPPPLSLAKQEQESETPTTTPHMAAPKHTRAPDECLSRMPPPDAKKRSGKRTLLFVTLLPAALIISGFLHHLTRIPPPDPAAVLDERSPAPIVAKREPQPQLVSSADPATLTSSGLPSVTFSSFQSSLSDPSQSAAPSTTSPLPTVPVTASLPTPFPQPFDASLSDNFTTTGCQAFFTNFTQDETFRQCRSFAFLLNSSSGFLQAQRNLTLMNSIIWGTCNTSPTAQACDAIMQSFLSQLNSICQKDVVDENPVVLQAQISFQSYTAMRAAACLPDPSTDAFCYIDAVAATTPADVYYYALPLGTPVPNTTKLSCSPCVKSVLAVYAQYVTPTSSGSGAVQIGAESGNSTASSIQPSPLPVLSKTYPAAARIAVNECGGTYASVGVAQPSGARPLLVSWTTVLLSLGIAVWLC